MRFLVEASWWVEAKDPNSAIDIIENAVAKSTEAELEDSQVMDEEESVPEDE